MEEPRRGPASRVSTAEGAPGGRSPGLSPGQRNMGRLPRVRGATVCSGSWDSHRAREPMSLPGIRRCLARAPAGGEEGCIAAPPLGPAGHPDYFSSACWALLCARGAGVNPHLHDPEGTHSLVRANAVRPQGRRDDEGTSQVLAGSFQLGVCTGDIGA